MKTQKNYTLDQLKNKVLYYINYRIRSKKEVLKKLQTLNSSLENTKIIIDELENLGLVNDEKFIRFFIQDLIETKKHGITIVKSELQKIGFESWLIQDSLQEYLNQEEYDPINNAYHLIEQKYCSNLPEDHKILGFLARRGFDYGTSSKALCQFKNNQLYEENSDL